jgi:hypothetical protein
MRVLIGTASLVVLLFAVGCHQFMSPRNPDPRPGQLEANAPTPTAESLVEYLNRNAKLIEPGQALNCNNLHIDIDADSGRIGVDNYLTCQAPRNFLMSGKIMSKPILDVGSNDKEFWFWCSHLKNPGQPAYLYHCSYDDLARGVQVPFPFQPDMVLSALGLAQYETNKQQYSMRIAQDKKGNKSYELIEKTQSLQKTPIEKITVFDYTRVDVPKPQVRAHIIKDDKGKVICTATILSTQRVGPKGFILPKSIVFNWPDQKMHMEMQLYNPRIMPMPADKAATLFNRSNNGNQSFDLATQTVDGGGVQRAGATYRAP